MIKVRIGENVYKMPGKVEDLSIEKGMRIDKLRDDFPEHNLRYKKWVLSALMECPMSELNKVQDSQIHFLYDNHHYFDSRLSFHVPYSFALDGVVYSLIDLDTLTVEDYTEIDALIDKGIASNLHKILAVLYRPANTRLLNPYYFIRSFFGVTPINRRFCTGKAKEGTADRFYVKIPFHIAKAMLFMYLDFKRGLLKEYMMLEDEEEEEEKSEDMEGEEVTFAQAWGMYHILQEVTGGDLVQLDNWMQKEIRQLFTLLYYRRQKDLATKK